MSGNNNVLKNNEEVVKMLRLIEKDHGDVTILEEGTLEDITTYLKDNINLYAWIWADDDGEHTVTVEEPNFDSIETLRDLEVELKKIDMDWWTLEVEEFEIDSLDKILSGLETRNFAKEFAFGCEAYAQENGRHGFDGLDEIAECVLDNFTTTEDIADKAAKEIMKDVIQILVNEGWYVYEYGETYWNGYRYSTVHSQYMILPNNEYQKLLELVGQQMTLLQMDNAIVDTAGGESIFDYRRIGWGEYEPNKFRFSYNNIYNVYFTLLEEDANKVEYSLVEVTKIELI